MLSRDEKRFVSPANIRNVIEMIDINVTVIDIIMIDINITVILYTIKF